MEVVGSSSVTIKGLTVHAAGASMGISFRGCAECFVTNCLIDGSDGVAFSVLANSSVIASGVRTQDRSGFWISDNSSAHVEGSEFDGGGMGWAGIMAGHAGVALVQSSVFRNAGVGLYAENGGVILGTAWSPDSPASSITIQNNWCGGVLVGRGAEFSSGVAVLVSDNGSERCAGSGVGAHSGGRLALSSIEVRNQHGTGISLSGQSHASLGSGIKVTGSLWNGLDVSYDSIAIGPPTWDTSTTVLITGNGGGDLRCDDSSRITGEGHFSGAPVVDCPNFVP